MGPRVVATLVGTTRSGSELVEHVFTLKDLIDVEDGGENLSSYSVPVGCRCGRFIVDIAAVLHGRRPTLQRFVMSRAEDREFGLNPDRLR